MSSVVSGFYGDVIELVSVCSFFVTFLLFDREHILYLTSVSLMETLWVGLRWFSKRLVVVVKKSS